MKLSELKKQRGSFWTSKDVIGNIIEINDDLNSESDFPLTEKNPSKDGQWFIIECRIGNEERRLHLTHGAMKSLAAVLPTDARTSWKGAQFKILSVTGSSYSTKTSIEFLGYAKQRTLDQPPASQPPAAAKPQPQPQLYNTAVRGADPLQNILLEMKAHSPLNDIEIEELVTQVCGSRDQGIFAWGILKSQGKVFPISQTAPDANMRGRWMSEL